MNYYYTNFYRWEQPLINTLRKRGYFVYGVRDCEGSYSIEDRVIVNNVGFLVTDEELSTPISEKKLATLGLEDIAIADKIREVTESIKEDLALEKERYNLGARERELKWEEAMKNQKNRMERDRHYNLSLRKDNPVRLPNGYGIRFQTIYDNGNGTQKVMYFITDPEGKIVVNSTEVTFNLNARYSKMAKVIAQKHLITI